jgi:hypothetical protein
MFSALNIDGFFSADLPDWSFRRGEEDAELYAEKSQLSAVQAQKP